MKIPTLIISKKRNMDELDAFVEKNCSFITIAYI